MTTEDENYIYNFSKIRNLLLWNHDSALLTDNSELVEDTTLDR